MSKYCLVYEAKDNQVIDAEVLLSDIAKLILDHKGYELKNPVAGTILFEDASERSTIGVWNDLLQKNLKGDIFYYLCQVASTRQGEYFERDEGDFTLDEEFQDMLDELEEE
jgi:hypothetical protein